MPSNQSFSNSNTSSQIKHNEMAEKGLVEMQSKYELLKKQLDEEEQAIIGKSS